MAESTGIAWTRSTFNPWIGCTKVSPGCDHCYASVSTPARAMGIEWGAGKPRRRTSAANWRLPLRWDRQQQIALSAWRRGLDMAGGDEAALIARGFIKPEPWRVFCGSLCDVFDNEVPDEWRRDLWDLIELTPHLTWLLLTKRIGNAARMLRSVDWAASPRWNVWLGASVVNQEEAERDIPKLLATPAAKRFVSYEPALGAVDLSRYLCPWNHAEGRYGTRLDWIIIGGESDQPGYKARPFDIRWARSTVQQCRETGVPVFVKQLGSNTHGWCLGNALGGPEFHVECQSYEASEQEEHCPAGICIMRSNRAGADPAEWPEDLRVREFPRV